MINNEELDTERDEEEKKEESLPSIPRKWKKFVEMQKAGVNDLAILQLASVRGKTPTKADVSELRELLGMKVDDDADGGSPSPSKALPPLPPRKHFRRFLAMKRQGIPDDAILQSASIQGENCDLLRQLLDEVGKEDQGGSQSTPGKSSLALALEKEHSNTKAATPPASPAPTKIKTPSSLSRALEKSQSPSSLSRALVNSKGATPPASPALGKSKSPSSLSKALEKSQSPSSLSRALVKEKSNSKHATPPASPSLNQRKSPSSLSRAAEKSRSPSSLSRAKEKSQSPKAMAREEQRQNNKKAATLSRPIPDDNGASNKASPAEDKNQSSGSLTIALEKEQQQNHKKTATPLRSTPTSESPPAQGESQSPSPLKQQDNHDKDRSKFDKYDNMRKRGIGIGYILEAARNQFMTVSEIAELERMLAEVQPSTSKSAVTDGDKTEAAAASEATTAASNDATPASSAPAKNDENSKDSLAKSERSNNKWFTPIRQEENDQNQGEEEEEMVAFHRSRSSPLASLVRKMVLTVDKTSRNSTQKKRGKKGDNSVAEDDLVVDSSTLYNALGSFKGVQIARDNYNETLVASEDDSKKVGWIRAKRQAYREIARNIGARPPSTKTKKDVNVDGLNALIRYIEDRYSDEIQESLSLLRDNKLYDFDSLSSLYVPGSRVVAKNICSGGVDMICRVAWNRIKSGRTITGQISKHFEVCFEYVVAVGTNTATIAEVVEGIGDFEGRRNIFSSVGLTFVPWMAYSEEEQESLLEKYRRRGRIYNAVALNYHPNQPQNQRPTYSYMGYRKGSFFVKRGGFGGTVNSSSASRGMATTGRIVIDSQGAYEYGNSLGVGYDEMVTGIHYKLKEYRLHQARSAREQQQQQQQESGSRANQYQTKNESDVDDEGMVLFDAIPEDYLEFVWPCVIGFSLTAKAWGDCLVDGLEDILFSEDVFDRLVLPEDRKRLIKALVKNSSPKASGDAHNFQDLIKGKGEGTVFLLYGPPGVGKTLTAEAVSEVLQRPLYSLSMGTLGTTADDLERRLTEILKLSAKWNAIILLDEADSFLESRSSTSSLERNAMVSVMLQLVEYFSGILFLTSNRMDFLDPAFQTRITLSLPYHNLTEESRQKIWDNLLHTSGVDDSHKMDTTELAKHPLNGREIKNALRLALSLASEEDRSLCHELLMQTSAMVRPISALEMTENESVADPPPLVLAQPKPSYFWRYVAITLLVLILTLQQSVLLLYFVSNVSEDGLETDKEVVVESMDEEAIGEMNNGIFDNPIDVSLPKRKFFGKLVLFWKKSRETWKDLS